MPSTFATPCARLRIVLRDGAAIGPGKAELLEGIRDSGSIAAAGRRMGMSYKRAWQLVETLNGYFEGPLVEAAKGGPRGGGATLTPLGGEILEAYRRMEREAGRVIDGDLRRLQSKLGDTPK